MNNNSSILVNNNTPIGILEWDEVVRCIIMFSDKVWLRSSYDISNKLDNPCREHISNTLKELSEESLVSFYALESDQEYLKKNAQRIITIDEHMNLYNSITERIKNKSSLIIDELPDPERTSRIIIQRNELWILGLATILNSDLSIPIQGQERELNYNKEMSKLAINSKVVTELFNVFDINSLAHLEIKDIISFRENAKKHRLIISRLVNTIKDKMDYTIEKAVKEEYLNCIDELNQLAQTVSGNKAIAILTKNMLAHISGFFFAPIVAVFAGMDLFNFFRNYNKYKFTLFMHSLSKKSKNNP